VCVCVCVCVCVFKKAEFRDRKNILVCTRVIKVHIKSVLQYDFSFPLPVQSILPVVLSFPKLIG